MKGELRFGAAASAAGAGGAALKKPVRRVASARPGASVPLMLATVIASVFLGEVLVMIFLSWSGVSSLAVGAVFDGLFISFLVFPILYFFLARPLQSAEAELAVLREQADVSGEAYRSLIDSTEDSIYLVDVAGRYRFINRHHASRLGLAEVDVIGRTYGELHPPDKTAEFEALVREAVGEGRSVCREHWSARDERWFLRTFSPVTDRSGATVAVTVVSKDVTELKRNEQRLRELSATDELTGLKNRRGFEDLAGHRLKLAERQGVDAALVYADLDGLKRINDTHGHPAGDRAIRAAAAILREACRESDVCGRLGGDEFALLLTGGGPEAVGKVLERIGEGVRRHNAAAAPPLSLSVGVATRAPGGRESLAELIASADAGMYGDKAGRRPRPARQPPARSA